MSKFYALFLAIACLGCHHTGFPQTEKMLQSLLDQKEYFKLRDLLALDADKISREKNLYFAAYIDNAFNRNDASLEKIRTLLRDYSHDLSDSTKALLLEIEVDNYFKTFQYAKAARADSDLINHYQHAMDGATFASIKNSR